MTRTLLVLAVLAVFALLVLGMLRGWRRRQAEQAGLPPFPAPPADPGPELRTPVEGLYVGTVRAGDWQDRVVVGDVGHRAAAALHLHASGLLVEREGATPLWLPAGRIRGARTARGLANKVVGRDGLLVVRWALGPGVEVDTGFRDEDPGRHGEWVTAVEDVATGRNGGDDGEVAR